MTQACKEGGGHSDLAVVGMQGAQKRWPELCCCLMLHCWMVLCYNVVSVRFADCQCILARNKHTILLNFGCPPCCASQDLSEMQLGPPSPLADPG